MKGHDNLMINSFVYIVRANEFNCYKILEALNSCYSYLIALSNERISFWNTLHYPHCNVAIEELDHSFTSVKSLNEYFEIFKEVAWKKYSEVST